MAKYIKGYKLQDVSIIPTGLAKSTAMKWPDVLPIFTYPSINIINGDKFNKTSNINAFLYNHIGVTVSLDTPLEFRKNTVEYFPTQFEIDELEEAIVSGVDISKWRLLILETPTISEMWYNFIRNLYQSGKKFGELFIGMVNSPEQSMYFTNLATYIIVGNDYTDKDAMKKYYYPIAGLLMDIENYRKSYHTNGGPVAYPSIIAMDEELESIDGVIKALALGADYVMSGKMIIKAAECAGEVFKYDSDLKDLIRFTDKELPEGMVQKMNSTALKKYSPYRCITRDTVGYEVTYSIAEYAKWLRSSLCELLSLTTTKPGDNFRNNITVIINR